MRKKGFRSPLHTALRLPKHVKHKKPLVEQMLSAGAPTDTYLHLSLLGSLQRSSHLCKEVARPGFTLPLPHTGPDFPSKHHCLPQDCSVAAFTPEPDYTNSVGWENRRLLCALIVRESQSWVRLDGCQGLLRVPWFYRHGPSHQHHLSCIRHKVFWRFLKHQFCWCAPIYSETDTQRLHRGTLST